MTESWKKCSFNKASFHLKFLRRSKREVTETESESPITDALIRNITFLTLLKVFDLTVPSSHSLTLFEGLGISILFLLSRKRREQR